METPSSPTLVDAPSSPQPRSSRVGVVLSPSVPPPPYDPSSSPLKSPPLPARSPLRPRPTPRPSQLSLVVEQPTDMPIATMPLLHRSFGSFSNLLDSINAGLSAPEKSILSIIPPRTPSPDKPLPVPPDPPLEESPVEEVPRAPSSPAPTVITKRTHALLELLSSERAYASDLALIRDIHIPLALGQHAPFPITPPHSSSSSERTMSTASDASGSSTLGQPMTAQDSRIIFSNISELALFSDAFSDRLEEALGSVLEGGRGKDYVGTVFIEMIPYMEPLYRIYITRHPTALEHLNKLPQTPALAAYLSHTRTLAASVTHAWDLPSLLIKPVQRLLKYSLLLNAIMEETPDSHPDKVKLRKAKEMMDLVSHGVNEGQRRREIVKEVLLSGKSTELLKKKGLGITVTTTVNLGKTKGKATMSRAENEEADRVAKMEKHLGDAGTFINAFAKDALDWCSSVRRLMVNLRDWAQSFGRVIGLTEEQTSEAFDAFISVVDPQLIEFYRAPRRFSLKPCTPWNLLTALYSTITLRKADHNLRSLRLRSRTLHFAENCIQNYRAISGCSITASRCRSNGLHNGRRSFGAMCGSGGVSFGTPLRVEGEMNAGSEETERVWKMRWAEVERDMQALNIVQPERVQLKPRSSIHTGTRSSTNASSMSTSSKSRAVAVNSMLNALEPIHVSTSPTSTSSLYRHYGYSPNSDLSFSSRHTLARRPSSDSLHSIRSAKSTKSTKSSSKSAWMDDSAMMASRMPHAPRRQSAPLPLRKTSSQGKLMDELSWDPIFDLEQMPVLPDRGRARNGREDRGGFGLRQAQNLMGSLRSARSSSRKSRAPPQAPKAQAHPHDSNMDSFAKWREAPAQYVCRVIHPCEPPEGVSYFGLPFFRLKLGTKFEVLKEAGHPSLHEDLPLHVDDGEDCLLLVRKAGGELGWVLASFLYPVD
ncbi:hypothetical protein EW146_g2634 [Bondarzewia mesenterica]|uniref:DH domain-containing protein n=1 Tax=Bondarzewia mesenterica TaxID=1095465 RepID=A0A4S4M002_9AGAM|nr:hypothetical protein EW146_g2634 [Bondarzewia mesenterica]